MYLGYFVNSWGVDVSILSRVNDCDTSQALPNIWALCWLNFNTCTQLYLGYLHGPAVPLLSNWLHRGYQCVLDNFGAICSFSIPLIIKWAPRRSFSGLLYISMLSYRWSPNLFLLKSLPDLVVFFLYDPYQQYSVVFLFLPLFFNDRFLKDAQRRFLGFDEWFSVVAEVLYLIQGLNRAAFFLIAIVLIQLNFSPPKNQNLLFPNSRLFVTIALFLKKHS